jgi:hypothetical protein
VRLPLGDERAHARADLNANAAENGHVLTLTAGGFSLIFERPVGARHGVEVWTALILTGARRISIWVASFRSAGTPSDG